MRDGRDSPLAEPGDLRVFTNGPKDPGIGWRARCNGFGSPVRVTPTRLELQEIGGTLIGCEQEAEEEDEWLVDFFKSDPAWGFEQARLTLTAGDRTIELVEKEK